MPCARELAQPAELLAAPHEDVGLAGQVRASGLDEQENREAVRLGDFHAPQQLADRRRARGPPAHRGVVGHDEALRVRHLGQRHDDATADRVPRVQSGQGTQLEQRRAGVHQCLHPLAHEHLAAGAVALDVLGTPARQHLVVQQRAPRRCSARMAAAFVAELVTRDGEV